MKHKAEDDPPVSIEKLGCRELHVVMDSFPGLQSPLSNGTLFLAPNILSYLIGRPKA
jgi:hypothetical protein